ncbi:PAS sensor protein, partial [Streptomyces anthocyanicus]
MNFTRWSARLPGTQRRAARATEGSVPAARGEYGPRSEHPAEGTAADAEATLDTDATEVPALEDFSVRDLLGRLPGLVALVYGPEHRIAYVNEAYASAFGPRTPGATVAATCPEAEELGLLPLLDQVLRSGKPRTVKSRRTADGGSYTVTCLPVDSPHLDGAGVL